MKPLPLLVLFACLASCAHASALIPESDNPDPDADSNADNGGNVESRLEAFMAKERIADKAELRALCREMAEREGRKRREAEDDPAAAVMNLMLTHLPKVYENFRQKREASSEERFFAEPVDVNKVYSEEERAEMEESSRQRKKRQARLFTNPVDFSQVAQGVLKPTNIVIHVSQNLVNLVAQSIGYAIVNGAYGNTITG